MLKFNIIETLTVNSVQSYFATSNVKSVKKSNENILGVRR